MATGTRRNLKATKVFLWASREQSTPTTFSAFVTCTRELEPILFYPTFSLLHRLAPPHVPALDPSLDDSLSSLSSCLQSFARLVPLPTHRPLRRHRAAPLTTFSLGLSWARLPYRLVEWGVPASPHSCIASSLRRLARPTISASSLPPLCFSIVGIALAVLGQPPARGLRNGWVVKVDADEVGVS